MLPVRWNLTCFKKRFRSFNAKNLGSVEQRSAKLLAVKVFSVFKDLYPFQSVSKVKGAGSNLRVSFALSKWPYFHRVYLVTVCKPGAMAVDKCTLSESNSM